MNICKKEIYRKRKPYPNTIMSLNTETSHQFMVIVDKLACIQETVNYLSVQIIYLAKKDMTLVDYSYHCYLPTHTLQIKYKVNH